MSELDSYWKFFSTEAFCIKLAIEQPVIGSLNEAEIIGLVKNIFEEKNIELIDYLINKYGYSIEHYFKKSEDSLYDLIFDESNNSFHDVVVALTNNDVIQL